MTLDEAIQHCKDKVVEQSSCNKECALDHEQLLEWLQELKNLRNK